MQLAILCGETRIDLSVKPGDAGSTVHLGERSLSLAADWRSGQPFWRGSIDGAAVRFKISTVDEIITLSRRGQRTSLRVLTPRQADLFDRLTLQATLTEPGSSFRLCSASSCAGWSSKVTASRLEIRSACSRR